MDDDASEAVDDDATISAIASLRRLIFTGKTASGISTGADGGRWNDASLRTKY